jgi:hypothetical protein
MVIQSFPLQRYVSFATICFFRNDRKGTSNKMVNVRIRPSSPSIHEVKVKLIKRPPLKLMYITNRADVAKIAERNTVDRIWVDLEVRGKENRQGNVNSVKSNHTMSDITTIRNAISTSELLVRVNPLWEKSQMEIDEVVARGDDIVMLPMFKTTEEASRFIDMVNGRAKVLLLVETINAEENIDEISSLPGVDEIYIGLNDLHLVYNMKFMFELLANGKIEEMTRKLRSHSLPFGFGGIARLDEGLLPARHIIAEHYRLGSSMAILSRSFYDSWLENEVDEIERVFQFGIAEIRDYEKRLLEKPIEYFDQMKDVVKLEVASIVARVSGILT